MESTKLRLLVKEEFNKFVAEAREYTNDDIVDAKDINLQSEYDKINQQLFGGTLPRVPMKWSNRKGNLGHVNSLYNRYTGQIKINHLAISAFHAMPYRVFKDTMAHEMIHIKQLAGGDRGSHGMSFYREMERINGMGLGYKITVRSDENLGVANTVQNSKTLIGIIMNFNGKYNMTVTTPNVYQAESNYLFDFLEKLVNSGRLGNVEVTVVESRNPELLKYKTSRTFRRGFSYGPLSDALLEQLLDDKILANIRYEKGKPRVMSEDAGEWEEMEISEGEWEEITIS